MPLFRYYKVFIDKIKYGFLLLVPFFLAGVLLAEVFRMFPALSARIYAADLIGAAAGSLIAIPFLKLFGGISTNFVLGGMASLTALLFAMGGVEKVTAVEINRDIVDMVRSYSWFNGGIYTDLDNVAIVVDEGRSFLRRQEEKYDIIMLSLPVTNTSRSLEKYALTENFIFTADSINDYLNHLTDEGRLVVVGHNDAEILRLLSLSLAALQKRGVDTRSGMNRIYIVGSVMTIVVAISFGFTEALLVSAGCYLIIFMMFIPKVIGSPVENVA